MSIIKPCSALSLVVIMLLSGCTEIPMRDAPEQPETSVIPVSHKPVVTSTKKYHVVRRGETLKGIAAQYKRNYKDVACWNNLRAPDYNINSGQRLLLDGPRCRQTVPTTTAVPVPIVTPPTPVVVTKPQAKEGTHVVQAGEQLFVIAKHYGKRFSDIAVWNNIKAPFHLRTGQVLRLTPPEISVSKSKPRDPNYHIVLPGDSLSTLARNYRQKFADLVRWNNLEAPYNVSIGQRLRVTPPAGSRTSPRVTRVTPPSTSKPSTSKPSTSKPRTSKPRTSSSSPSVSTLSEYTVKPGDSFKSIAKRYGIAVDELADWNGMGPPYTVYPGLKLMLEPPPK